MNRTPGLWMERLKHVRNQTWYNNDSTLYCYMDLDDSRTKQSRVSGKSQDHYESFFRQIKVIICRRFGNYGAVQTIIIDYESSAHNAIRVIFPNETITGCNFHYGQVFVRNMHSEMITREVPIDKVGRGWRGRRASGQSLVWLRQSIGLTTTHSGPVWMGNFAARHGECVTSNAHQAEDLLKLRNFAQYFTSTWIDGRMAYLHIQVLSSSTRWIEEKGCSWPRLSLDKMVYRKLPKKNQHRS